MLYAQPIIKDKKGELLSRQIQIRRGTAAEHENFIGKIGEVTMDTTNKTLRVHDGETAGGIKLAKENEIDLKINDYFSNITLPSRMPDYSQGVTFTANTPIQAPYDCIVFWNAYAASNIGKAVIAISKTGAFCGEELTFAYYANSDGYSVNTFFIPKGWYFRTSRNFESPSEWSPSQYFPLI